MAGLLSLPTEILDRVCSLVDLQTRKALRLANRRLSTVGQRWIFDTAIVSPTDASCDRLDRILESTGLASYVTKIYLNTWDLDLDNVSQSPRCRVLTLINIRGLETNITNMKTQKKIRVFIHDSGVSLTV
jgi:hypothetical protein